MRRFAPLLAAVLAVTAVVVLRPFGPPPSGACAQEAVVPRIDCDEDKQVNTAGSCAGVTRNFARVSARPRGRGVRVGFRRTIARPATVALFQSSTERRVLPRRRVRRVGGLNGARTIGARGLGSGFYVARFTLRDARGRLDVRRVALRRSGGRFRRVKPFERRPSCSGPVRIFRLDRPVFGGPTDKLQVIVRLARAGRVSADVLRGGKVVRRLARSARKAGSFRLRVRPRGLRRGRYAVRVRYAGRSGSLTARLFAFRL